MTTDGTDYYTLLDVPRESAAPPSVLKAAYHRALLRAHPDKRSPNTPKTQFADVDHVRDAYRTLSDPILRAAYDRTLSITPDAKHPRPAQVISLEDFDEGADGYAYACRCGGTYRIGEEEMETGVHLVGCGSCSEVIWIGYEVLEEEGSGD
ncbi:hypothetical protein OF83DRAFT_1166186 [Amylostereum chailletii]|nr:hypothetical protein OF83DRAFT_1166186 [Amylostereum chailletii]